MFPTGKLMDNSDEIPVKINTVEDFSHDKESMAASSSSSKIDNEFLQDLVMYMGALAQCESVFEQN